MPLSVHRVTAGNQRRSDEAVQVSTAEECAPLEESCGSCHGGTEQEYGQVSRYDFVSSVLSCIGAHDIFISCFVSCC